MRQRRFARLAAGGVLVLAVGAGAALAADLWTQIGAKEADARREAGYALTSGHVPYYLAAKAFLAAGPAVRASLVSQGLAWAKSYFASAEFASAYRALREQNRPAAAPAAASGDQRLKAMLDEQRKQLEESKKNLAQLPPDLRKQMEPVIKQMEAQLQKTASDPQMLEMMKQGFAAEAQDAQESHRQRVAAWEKTYPAEPSALIVLRLREFLETSASVDYAAKLTRRGDRMVFADPRLEDRSSEWKLCYRAGREAVDAARASAKAWLAELEKR